MRSHLREALVIGLLIVTVSLIAVGGVGTLRVDKDLVGDWVYYFVRILPADDQGERNRRGRAVREAVTSYTVSDGRGGSDTALVAVTLSGVNNAPVAEDGSFSVQQNGSYSGSLIASDVDNGDTCTYEITAGPSEGAISSFDPDSGAFTYEPGDYSGSDSLTFRATDNHSSVSNTATVSITVTPLVAGPELRKGTVAANTAEWVSVDLGANHTYKSMVVILTPNYDKSDAPMVARVRNASGSSFDVKLDRADGQSGSESEIYDVHYIVVEEGVYTEPEHGVKMEAVKFTSTVTDENNSWVGQSARGDDPDYANSYTDPVVVGQVMTCNDPDWSVFWARGSDRKTPPSASTLYVGKHVAEDPDNTRSDETIGYIVIEAGSGSIGGIGYVAGLGADTVRGFTDGNGYTYNITHLPNAEFAVASAAAMDGGNGGWPVLYGETPVTEDTLVLGFDEDQLKDSERAHTTEQVAYIVLDPPAEATPPAQSQAVDLAIAQLWGSQDRDESDDQLADELLLAMML